MTALRTRLLLALVAAGALTMAACAQDETRPTPTTSPTTTLVETLSPLPPAPPELPPPPPAAPPVSVTPEESTWPERVLQYCEGSTGIYGPDDYVLEDPYCYQPPTFLYCDGTVGIYAEGGYEYADPRCVDVSGDQTYTDEDGSWTYICTGPDDPRPAAECTVPAN